MAQTARLARAHAYEDERAHLRVVPRRPVKSRSRAAAKTRKPRQAPRRVADARVRALFTSCVALLIALTGVGLVRVAVVARAAEMTITADKLSREIKAQRIETDELELDRSSLQAPSRIDGIASETMKMGAPASVRYMSIPGEKPADEGRVAVTPATTGGIAPVAETPGAETADAAAAPASDAVSAALAAIVKMSAGEAQALLLGDIGLAGSR